MEQNQNNRIEEKLARAFEAQTPNNLDAILADCKEKKGKELKMKRNFEKITSAIAAAFVLMLGLIFAVKLIGNAPLTTVAIDVNPSIELNLDKNENVVSVNALNSDAATIIEGLELEGRKLDKAIKLIVGSMIEKGYISELANSILVSVDGDDERSAALRDKLASMIKSILDDDKIEGSVLSQTHTPNDDIKALAEKYNISTGKAAIISKLVAADGTHLFEELVTLSVNELNILLEKVNSADTSLNKQGNASTKSYIDKNTAIAAALSDLGVTEADVTVIESDLDYEHGMMVYEIEFRYGANEYEYEINATDASVVRVEIDTDDRDDDRNDDDDAPPAELITEAEAKKAALTDASVNAEDVLSFRTELNEDDNVWYYEVNFKTASTKYEYEIHAVSGKIIDKDVKTINTVNTNNNNDDRNDNNSPNPSTTITKEEAIAAALAHAGVTEDSVRELDVELDGDHGIRYYEIEFKSGGYEYEYKISATDKSVIHSEKDRD